MSLPIEDKIIYGLERISEVFKSLLWEKAKIFGISPIQIQLLIFIHNHKINLCSVSHLAKEFNVTKPTVSDAVKVLFQKKLVDKDFSVADNRSYHLFITPLGEDLIHNIIDYALPFKVELEKIDQKALEELYQTMTNLIFLMNKNGLIEVQRTCFGCKYYESSLSHKHYCHLLEQPLESSEIRLDCKEFESN